MTNTNISLNGSDLEKRLHHHMGTDSAKEFEFKGDYDAQNIMFPYEKNCYIYKPEGPYRKCKPGTEQYYLNGSNRKKYWITESEDKIVLLTTQMIYGDLAKKENNSYRVYFNRNEINDVIDLVKRQNHQVKPIHVIIPRVEKGFREDHIVLEYHDLSNPDNSLIIDSKPAPDGFQHQDPIPRVHTNRQELLNATDCGFHVNQTIPILQELINSTRPVTANAIKTALYKEGFRSFAIDKLYKLENEYSKRCDLDKNDRHITLFFFHFGYKAKYKKEAITQMLENIKNGERDIYKGLEGKALGAAKQGVLGKTAEEYLDSLLPVSPLEDVPNIEYRYPDLL